MLTMENVQEFFKSGSVYDLDYYLDYIDYDRLFEKVLQPEYQEFLPAPLEKIQNYRGSYENSAIFKYLKLDYNKLGIDLKDYFDYVEYTKDYLMINDLTLEDLEQNSSVIREYMGLTSAKTLFEELDEWVKNIPSLHLCCPPKKTEIYVEKDLDFDDEDFIDDDDEFLNDYLNENER